MSFSQVAVHGTVSVSDATDTVVTFRLNTALTDGLTLLAPETLAADCATDGTFSITLPANDDNTTLPTGSFYRVEVVHRGVAVSCFSIVVPSSSAGSGANLLSLTTLPVQNQPVVSPYVSIVDGVGTNLGPAQTLDLASLASEKWLVGTLNANLTVTVANATPGRKGVLLLTQDGTGGRTLAIADTGGSQPLVIPASPGVSTVVQLYITDAGNVFAIQLGVPGPTGATGPAGTNGTNGTNGSVGATGPAGPAGSGITIARTTSLPSSPVADQVCSLVVDDTNGVDWLLRWDATKGLWRCQGSAALTAYVASVNSGTAQAVTTSYVAITGGPSLTLPNVGSALDVVLEHGMLIFGGTGSSGVGSNVGLSIGGSAPRATDPTLQEFQSGAAIGTRTSSSLGPIENAAGSGVVAPGAVITQQLKGTATNATGFSMSQAWIAVRCLGIHP